MPSDIEVVRGALQAFGRGDIAGLLEMCSDDVRVVFYGASSEIPFSGTWSGKQKVAEYFRRIGEAIDVRQWEPRHEVAAEGHVVAFVLAGFSAQRTGKAVSDSHLVLDFTVGNGKVTGWEVYVDTAAWEKVLSARRASV